ncbi:retroelement silencing factor 1 isoform X2 [Chelonia mydas]|uniref:retroelement silencing factor 1 isoform X2 n=1 Tax=Chelonia mydas TaxID=8469 RepID=UPI001CA96C47|nr:retroelement silencing factor 1 isoform X2 [Chelonia mydas]
MERTGASRGVEAIGMEQSQADSFLKLTATKWLQQKSTDRRWSSPPPGPRETSPEGIALPRQTNLLRTGICRTGTWASKDTFANHCAITFGSSLDTRLGLSIPASATNSTPKSLPSS